MVKVQEINLGSLVEFHIPGTSIKRVVRVEQIIDKDATHQDFIASEVDSYGNPVYLDGQQLRTGGPVSQIIRLV